MPKPTLLIEVAFDSGYSTPAASRTWTDVTSYVRHLSGANMTKWRGEEYDVANASRLSLTLENADGRFTPGKTGGAHYPNVKRGRPIRVTSTHNGNTYRRFLGYIEDWTVSWPGTVNSSAVCEVTASSRMARMGAGMLLRSIIEEEILPDLPVVYYMFGEPLGSRVAFDSSGNNAPPLGPYDNFGSLATFGQATGLTTDDLTAVTFASGTHRYLGTQGAFVIDDVPLTMGCFFSMASVPSVAGDLMSLYSPELSIGLGVRDDGFASAGYAGAVFVNGTTNLCDGQFHHVSVTASRSGGTGSLELYVDGVSISTASGAVTTGSPFVLLNVGSMGGSTATLTVAHGAVFDAVLSSTRIAAHAGAGLTGFAGETPAARLARYAGYAGIPTAEQSFETGDVLGLAHIDTTDKTPLACMREVEATEGGVLFDAGDGTLKFHDRSHRYGAASAFSTSLSPVVVPLTPILNDQSLVNDMTVTGSTGIAGRATDATSLAAYGRYDRTLDVASSNVDEPLHAASWRVGRYAEPAARIPGVEIHLNKASVSLTDSVLAAEVGTKFTLTGLLGSSPASSMVLFVEGVDEYIDATEHRVVLKTSPAEVFDLWILDDSTYSVLDSTTRLAW